MRSRQHARADVAWSRQWLVLEIGSAVLAVAVASLLQHLSGKLGWLGVGELAVIIGIALFTSTICGRLTHAWQPRSRRTVSIAAGVVAFGGAFAVVATLDATRDQHEISILAPSEGERFTERWVKAHGSAPDDRVIWLIVEALDGNHPVFPQQKISPDPDTGRWDVESVGIGPEDPNRNLSLRMLLVEVTPDVDQIFTEAASDPVVNFSGMSRPAGVTDLASVVITRPGPNEEG